MAGAEPVPAFHEWNLKSTIRPPKGQPAEERKYEQGELSIEGEARLLGQARKIGAILKDRNFNLDAISVMVNTGEPNWDVIFEAMTIVTEEVPRLIGESACVLLGVFPTLEDGTPNPEYEDHERFLRNALNTAKFVDMLMVFVDQNDYKRLARPFWGRVRQESGSQPETAGSPESVGS